MLKCVGAKKGNSLFSTLQLLPEQYEITSKSMTSNDLEFLTVLKLSYGTVVPIIMFVNTFVAEIMAPSYPIPPRYCQSGAILDAILNKKS